MYNFIGIAQEFSFNILNFTQKKLTFSTPDLYETQLFLIAVQRESAR